MRLLYISALLFSLSALHGAAQAASLTVRRQGDTSEFTAELGEVLDMEVIIDAGAEEVTGCAFFLSFDSQVFDLLPAGEDEAGQPGPFAAGDFLRGIILVNQIEEIGGETFLSYTEAAGGVERRAASGTGVMARFRLAVERRPVGDMTYIRIEERGHDRVSHYVTVDAPGVEKRFARPLAEAAVRVTGFRIQSLPDVVVIEGESQVVFDLDAFVDTTVTQVIWTHTRISEVPTEIDPETREVTMSPPPGKVGGWPMIFTALEANEGLTAADEIRIQILSRPKIADFPATVTFAEDTSNQELDLDGYVDDVDDLDAELTWTPTGGENVHVEVNPQSHIVTFTAAPDFFGEEEVIFAVSDRTALGDTVSILVVVTPVNDPPEIKRVPPAYPVQGAGPVAVPLAELVEDRDDDLGNLQFHFEADDGVWGEIQGDTLLIHGDISGRRILDIAVQDTSGAEVRGRQIAVVLEPGEEVRPEIERLPEMRFTGGQSGSLNLDEFVRDDSPADSLKWAAAVDTSGLAATVRDDQLEVAGESGFAGTGTVQLTVTDPQGNQDSIPLAVSVLKPGDDLGPRVFDPGKIGLLAGGETRLDLDELVDDPDHQDSDIEWTFSTTAGLEFDEETGTLRQKEGEELVRPASLTLKATDPSGASHEIEVPVLVAAPGEPPQVRDFPEVSLDSLAATVRLDLDDFAFDDLDVEPELLWTAEAEPGVEAEIDPVSHVLKLRRAPVSGPVPPVTQVVLRVRDTAGQETTAILQVGLPSLFELRPIPDIQLMAGQVDTSLVLDDFVISGETQLTLTWKVEPTEKVDVQIDPVTHRVRLAVADESFQGRETLVFTATATTQRWRTAEVQVIVKGRGLTPQLRDFPRVEIEEGQVDASIDLDDFVVDDDPDSLLRWLATGQRNLVVEIDSLTHALTLGAEEATPGVEQIQFLVRDPAGNTAQGVMEVVVVRGGEPPEIAPLPQVLLIAGGPEKQLDLAPFASDPDTPAEEISWEVSAEPGVGARLDGSRLFVSVETGLSGSHAVEVTATDPQGNRMTAEMKILIQEDAEAPTFAMEVGRHPVFSELIEVRIRPSEGLRETPQVRLDTSLAEVAVEDDSTYLVTYPFPPQPGERSLDISVRGSDLGGNQGSRLLTVALRWMDEQGGNLSSPDLQVLLNVPDAATGSGHLAVLYRLGEPETPASAEGQPVYAVDMLRGRPLSHPVILNFFAGAAADTSLRILRWDETSGAWEQLPTMLDAETGWFSVSTEKLGLFRLGEVDPEERWARVGEADPESKEEMPFHYPNPFFPEISGNAQIVYQVSTPGQVRLEVFNVLGQRVRLLVDEFQEVGTWNALWNGRDENDGRLGSGVYFYELSTGGRRHRRPLVLIH